MKKGRKKGRAMRMVEPDLVTAEHRYDDGAIILKFEKMLPDGSSNRVVVVAPRWFPRCLLLEMRAWADKERRVVGQNIKELLERKE